MIRAMLELMMLFARLRFREGDIEVVFRCRVGRVQDALEQEIADSIETIGSVDTADPSRRRPRGEGTIHGVPFRIEAMH